MKSVLENYFSCIPALAIKLCIILLVVASLSHVTAAELEFEARLEALSQALEAQRIEHHIPGFAIAIVKDGEVVLSKGFGLANIEHNTPITPQSLFAIGSTTKAFTATIAGMLVDQEKMNWDDPLTDYLPYYTFVQNDKPVGITLRDTLSHRSGYARNDLLWVNGKVSSEQILKDATQAEKWAPFRKQFHYNNVMYLAAGTATASQSNPKSNWANQLTTRLLTPLNMLNTTLDLAQAKNSKHLATGYMWHDELGEHKVLPMRNLTNIGPAGAINSNVEDMANWLKFQLAKGEFQGKRLISENALLETHSPQIQMAKDIHYGLGWMLRNWQGQKVVEHGGNIDGFGAQVTLFPESNLGYVLLTNITATPLQQLSINLVANYLLAPALPTQNLTPPTNGDDFNQYIGEYTANFGPFKNTIFKVLLKDGKLAVDVPGQTIYALKSPNQQGKWLFELTDTIAVSFDKNQQGQIAALRMHQNGMDFELPKKGLPIIPEISAAELQKYLGSYYSKQLKSNSTAIIQNHRLAIDVPGQMVYELNLPNDNGEWTFRINPNMHVVFNQNADKQITSLSFYRDGKQNGEMPRVEDKNQTPLPSVKEILALRRTQAQKQALLKAGGILAKGTVIYAQAGISGTTQAQLMSDTHARYNLDFGKYGNVQTAITPSAAATQSSFSPFQQHNGKYLSQIQKSYPMLDLDWSSFYQSIEVLKRSELNNKPVYLVLLKNAEVPSVTAYIDTKNGDVLKIETKALVPTLGSLPYSLDFADYREVAGMRLPFKVTKKDNQAGKVIFKFDSFEVNREFDEAVFELSE
ncbi:serine hydrolase [Paraglaciecola aquimarina]|uniref:Serine hydrolase n=2 Tax=Paraglaciecola algarum TaxID=3050085 RepID=A0ABS9DAI1_9ALTE|nr:serine hydrolase [Paraglaciecola sp. G1-23]